jgi:hypothetical protein
MGLIMEQMDDDKIQEYKKNNKYLNVTEIN